MEVIVARFQEGVCLNPFEYLMEDDSSDYLVFNTEMEAKIFLMAHGIAFEELNSYHYLPAMCR